MYLMLVYILVSPVMVIDVLGWQSLNLKKSSHDPITIDNHHDFAVGSVSHNFLWWGIIWQWSNSGATMWIYLINTNENIVTIFSQIEELATSLNYAVFLCDSNQQLWTGKELILHFCYSQSRFGSFFAYKICLNQQLQISNHLEITACNHLEFGLAQPVIYHKYMPT